MNQMKLRGQADSPLGRCTIRFAKLVAAFAQNAGELLQTKFRSRVRLEGGRTASDLARVLGDLARVLGERGYETELLAIRVVHPLWVDYLLPLALEASISATSH